MPKGVINLGPVHAYLLHPRRDLCSGYGPTGSISGRLIEHRKRAQPLESIDLADESEGADRYNNKCTWVTPAEVRPAPFPRSGENITQLRDGKHKPTPVRIQHDLGQCDPRFQL